MNTYLLSGVSCDYIRIYANVIPDRVFKNITCCYERIMCEYSRIENDENICHIPIFFWRIQQCGGKNVKFFLFLPLNFSQHNHVEIIHL